MKHWRKCELLTSRAILTEYDCGKLIIKAPIKEVEKELDTLYDTLSRQVHFQMGDSLPI